MDDDGPVDAFRNNFFLPMPEHGLPAMPDFRNLIGSIDDRGPPGSRSSDPLPQRLAYQVIYGAEPDAVWPLIDSLLEARDRPADFPTSAEMLDVIREYTEWTNSSYNGSEPLKTFRAKMKDIVRRAATKEDPTDE